MDVTIPSDYKSELYLYYGLGKGDGDTIGSDERNTITISDVSFSTTRQVIESETVPQTSTKTTVKVTTKNNSTTRPLVTTKNNSTTRSLGTTVVKKATKKKNTKKINLSFNKVKGAKKYQVQVSKSRKFTKIIVTKFVKKYKATITKKSFKKYKTLYVRVRAVGCKKWSKAKRVRNIK